MLNENVYSDKIASRNLSSRSMLVFGMLSVILVSEPQYDFGSIFLSHFSHRPSSRRKKIANTRIAIDRISGIP